MSGKSDRVDVLSKLLQSTAGRDQLMGLLQFLPAVLLPVVQESGNVELATSLVNLASLAGNYRSITRLTGAFSMLARGAPVVKPAPESIAAALSWFNGLCFLPAENTAVLTSHGVMCRNVPPEKKAGFGPRAVYFWFWSLVFENIAHVLTLIKLQNEGTSQETKKKMNAVINKWVEAACWFLLAWASMPQTGKGVQLMLNPEASIFRPLHSLVEATSVPGISLSPFLRGVCGLVPTVLAINRMTNDM
ncbi:Gim5A protein [Diplonema papillatum]|nr:Gim5A protein [Diplonema papillatum]|eukprot:gene16442-25202_t